MQLLDFPYIFEPGSSPDGPALLLLHGTGGDETSLISLGQDLAPGINLISPRGKVLEHGMPRFFRRLAEGVFDLEDLSLRTRELAGFIEAVRKEHSLTGPVIAVGYSNGANIAASLLLSYPALQGAVLFRAMLPFEPDWPADLSDIPVLLLNGVEDAMIPRENADRLAALLREAGSNVTHIWQPTGHGLLESDILAARKFLEEL